MEKNELIVQVHIPFCFRPSAWRRQPFSAYDPALCAAYVRALEKEIEAVGADLEGYEAVAVSLEGGNPSLLEPAGLQSILRAVRKHIPLVPDAQIALRTMPGEYSRALMEKMRDCGVNHWIVQLDTADLAEFELLRQPYRFDALTMVDAAIRTFSPRDLSFELLYGIPGQTEKSLAHSLETALAYQPEHLSLYPLVLSPGTALYRDCAGGKLTPPTEEERAALLSAAHETLLGLGYRPYTRCDYCQAGKENRFRLGQLRGLAQLGLGYRAVSILDGFRYTNGHSLEEYLAHSDELTVLAKDVVELKGAALDAWNQAREQMKPRG